MKKRDNSLDLFKGILTILMIFTHVMGIFRYNVYIDIICFYVNLTTFSGFMFSFGYVSYKAYISKKIKNKYFFEKMMKNFLKTILAFYISGITYSFFISNDLTFIKLIKILLFLEVPRYSEFLLSFAFTYLIIYVFSNIFNKMNKKIYLFLIIVSLLMTFIDYEIISIPLLGIFIGTNLYFCFPIVQYFSYYLGGLYLAKYKIIFDKKIFIFSLICTLLFIVYSIFSSEFPSRFPPSIYWIIGGYLYIYLYYLFCKNVKENRITMFISRIGRSTLSYLVLSNIIIFFSYWFLKKQMMFFDLFDYLIIYIVLFVLSILIPYFYNKLVYKEK